jgi:hypothetical protein
MMEGGPSHESMTRDTGTFDYGTGQVEKVEDGLLVMKVVVNP